MLGRNRTLASAALLLLFAAQVRESCVKFVEGKTTDATGTVREESARLPSVSLCPGQKEEGDGEQRRVGEDRDEEVKSIRELEEAAGSVEHWRKITFG